MMNAIRIALFHLLYAARLLPDSMVVGVTLEVIGESLVLKVRDSFTMKDTSLPSGASMVVDENAGRKQ